MFLLASRGLAWSSIGCTLAVALAFCKSGLSDDSRGWIPAQTFLMGDASGEGRADERPAHYVTLSRYWIAPRMVTAVEYCKFLNDSEQFVVVDDFLVPRQRADAADRTWGVLVNLPYSPIERRNGQYIPREGQADSPMYYVTWEGAAYYCNWLSEQEGLSPCYIPDVQWTGDLFSGGYHLPTEAQWECAAREAPTVNLGKPVKTDDSFKSAEAGIPGVATINGAISSDNESGVAIGILSEWCHDWYESDAYLRLPSGVQNPSGPPDVANDAMQMRSLRGAAHYQPAAHRRVSRRYGTSDTKGCFSYNGFRVVREDQSSVESFTGWQSTSFGSKEELELAEREFARLFLESPGPMSFTLGGRRSTDVLRDCRTERTEANSDGERRVVRTTTYDPESGVEFVCTATLYERFPAIDWVVTISNRSSTESGVLEALCGANFELELPANEQRDFILRHSRGSRALAADFMPTDNLIRPAEVLTFGGHGGRSSDQDLPFFNLQRGSSGALIGVGWTGQWIARFTRDGGRRLRVCTGHEYLSTRLEPGESVRTPRTVVCFWNGEDMLRGHNLFRQLILAHYAPRVDGQLVRPPIAASTAGLNGYTEENQLQSISKLKECGVETLWMDAGWFLGGWPNGAGTWTPKPEAFPRGLAPVGRAAHSAGLDFLLWFELERVSRGSLIAREYPQWTIGPITEYGGLFNWGDEEARRWMIEHVLKQLNEGEVDVLRQDMNMEPLGYWLRNDEPDRRGMTEVRFVEGMYQIFDELRKRRPGLWIDNCASGGRNIDLEMTMRSVPLWQSDAQCLPFPGETAQLQNHGLNLYLPFHAGGTNSVDGWYEPSYGFRSTMSVGSPLTGVAKASKEDINRTVNAILRARRNFEGDYYPLFEASPRLDWWFGYQLHRSDQNSGMILLFRRQNCARSETVAFLRAINPAALYEMTDCDANQQSIVTGQELMRLRVTCEKAPGSRLIFYRETSP